jgi:diketogulonate reductase-like aldo/keto reductase
MDETRIKNNIDLFNFEIEEKDMRLMSNLDRGEGLAWQHGDPTKVE